MPGAAPPGQSPSGVHLTELVGTLSLAVDLGLGQPMGHVVRSCLVAGRVGERMGLDPAERETLFYVALLGWLGCIADSREAASWFGDDIQYRAGVYDLDMAPLPFLGYLLRRTGSGEPAVRRLGKRAAVLVVGARSARDALQAHCQVTTHVAARLGLGPRVCEPLRQIFARWDGKGLPPGVKGADIAMPIRLWQVADVADVHYRRGGGPAAVACLRSRRGSQFDPDVVGAFCDRIDDLFDGLGDDVTWDDLVVSEPGLRQEMTVDQLDTALEAIADWVDIKSPYFGGHSRGVADLAAAAARVLGLGEPEVRTLWRAALVHDIGRTGVPNTIWDKAGPLTPTEFERVRLHSYYTERVLARPGELAALGRIAALAHERMDGSGYHRGLTAVAIPLAGRLLAAADTFHTKLEPRPHRAALTPAQAAGVLRSDVRAGRLDGTAVDAVLDAAGHEGGRQVRGGPGLTPREREVLTHLARGESNRQIARRLGISPKTAGNHVERIYAKAGVSTRAAATLYALEQGLLAR